MSRLRSAALGLAAGLAILLAPVLATGLLYLLRGPTGHFPGPRVPDALPLDALAAHGHVPLLVFAAVWIVTALLLGAGARALGRGRIAGALVLTMGIGVWLFVLNSFSIFVVDQVPVRHALAVATAGRAIYLAAGAAGAGGAILGRKGKLGNTRMPVALGLLTAAAGLATLASTLVDPYPQAGPLIRRLTQPAADPIVANAAAVAIGAGLIVVARGLARRNRRAWVLGVSGLGAAALYQLLKGLNTPGAFLAELVAIGLIARRDDFDALGDPGGHPRAALRAGLVVLAVAGYGSVALLVHQTLADQPVTVGFVAAETARAVAGLTLAGSHHLGGSFGRWFPPSMLLLAILGLGWVIWTWISPWRYRLLEESRHRELAGTLLRDHGRDTFAPFALRADKSLFFSEDERAFLAYRVILGVALVTGDPIGPPDLIQRLVERFLDHAHERSWRVAVLGVSAEHVQLYRALGLRALYEGDEAVIDIDAFSLEGRPMRKVRQAVHRLERAGYAPEVRHACDVEPSLREDLEAIAYEWQGGTAPRGFSMEMDSLFRLGGRDALFVIGRDAEGTVQGFLHFAVLRAGSALSLSTMPRRRTTPNGFNEWLISETAEWARQQGIERLSLNFSPFAGILAPSARTVGLRRVARTGLLALKHVFHFQLDNLFVFNDQFHPRWAPRYLVYEHPGDLPRVGMAALTAEGYLPLAKRTAA